MLAAAGYGQGGGGQAFPRIAARLYLSSGVTTATARLGAAPAPPDANAVAQAAATIRQWAGGASRSERERALAALVLGKGEAERGNTRAAALDLAEAAEWPPVRDVASAVLVQMWAKAKDPQATLAAADKYPLTVGDVFHNTIGKPAARAAAQLHLWSEAARWSAGFPHDPEMIWVRAQAEMALGQAHEAGLLERTLEYRYPASPEAAAAEPSWRNQLQSDPSLAVNWEWVEDKARAWTRAGRHRRAAATWAEALPMAPRSHRARIEAQEARAWLAAGEEATATRRLRGLLHSTERAQALEIEIEIARREENQDEIARVLRALRRDYPRSPWYAVGLHEAGNDAVLAYDDAKTQRRFDDLSRRFPHSVYAPESAWRAAWIAYRLNQPNAASRMEHYLRSWPNGASAPDAIFWLGMWEGRHGQPGLAQMCFDAAAKHFPGTYFGQQARQRMGSGGAAEDPPTPGWLRPYLSNRATPVAGPIPARFRSEVERADWIAEAGLDDPAAAILEHVFYQLPAGPASLEIARLLAPIESERGEWNRGLAAMIRALPRYMELHDDQLRPSDWRQLFPAPYASDVQAAARQFGLDPYLVLGLIRQESGFDPESVSSARARGLMQLELGTARGGMDLLPAAWRELKGPGQLSAKDLLKPGLNLALGSAELHRLLGQFSDPVYALAGYNAGSARVVQWQQQFPNLALDAFIESVPFTQTRGYIQAVLRNATRYRELYGHER